MEKYDPYNPNNLDEIFKDIKKDKKEKINKENIIQKEDIGITILKKIGWKGKGIK